ncbi:uncharacterized protein LOC124545868 [Schistocerca americana]|uniref:uncharacterized protein LOC124545868 n=1 Tax=Schistocerca americana TaxID=7009 RepID=UPI001F500C73|nr:uncharacterized protein LOC124545868 [Schistocerca americana]
MEKTSLNNGKNIVEDSRELRELQAAVSNHYQQTQVKSFMREEGIDWHLIPPASPHFGEIWEAGVKSFKYHIRRTMGPICPTFKDLTTLTCQIEACLKSRPLAALSGDPTDPQALIPGHLLIGTAITKIPQPDLGTTILSLLGRWELLRQGFQIFWRRRSSYYLHHLQQWTKWMVPSQNVQPGQLAAALRASAELRSPGGKQRAARCCKVAVLCPDRVPAR